LFISRQSQKEKPSKVKDNVKEQKGEQKLSGMRRGYLLYYGCFDFQQAKMVEAADKRKELEKKRKRGDEDGKQDVLGRFKRRK
jgi:hypothetical protein